MDPSELAARTASWEREHRAALEALSDPAVLRDPARLRQVSRREKELQALLEAGRAVQRAEADRAAARELVAQAGGSADRDLAREELAEAEAAAERAWSALRALLVPQDPDAGRDVIVEIRGAEGGEEANLFARDLFEMYRRYAERRGWEVEVLSLTLSDLQGIDQVTMVVRGEDAWQRLKHEGGPHRVQRVPATESQGRIHTSSATVTVLPQAEEVEVAIDPADLRIDVFRATGPGGQSVNTTDSAVRITHLPTGIVVQCQNERSQLANRQIAMTMLRAKLAERKEREREAELARERGEAQRVEFGSQIRSYVLHPYTLVKDHRTGVEVGDVQRVLDGDLDPFIRAYLLADSTASPSSAGL